MSKNTVILNFFTWKHLFSMANFVHFPWFSVKKKKKPSGHALYCTKEPLYTLVGHNFGKNAHKNSFLRGLDVMKDKYRA